MQLISLNDEKKLNNTIVTVGKFDGIHKGHEKLLQVVNRNANGRMKAVLTFETTPKEFLDDNANKTIVTEQEKRLLLEEQGVDIYFKMPITKEFLSLSPEAFLEQILIEKMGATMIVCGPDFRFGHQAMGDVEFLWEHQKQYGYKLIVVDKEQYHHKDISSSDIREKISEGKIKEANEMLDHPYRIIGKVEQGKQLGRTLGLPTANLIPEHTKLLPPKGVYKTVTEIDGKRYPSISNIGVNPTVETGNQIKVETHIMDYEDNLYGKVVQVLFYDFVREEKMFQDVGELKRQIEADIEKCRKL